MVSVIDTPLPSMFTDLVVAQKQQLFFISQNDSSWILSNLAALYWRIHGDGEQAINCLKHAIYYSGRPNLVSYCHNEMSHIEIN